MQSTTRGRLDMCRGEVSRAAQVASSVQAAYAAMSAADVLMVAAGYRPPDEDAAPSMAGITPKPSPAPAGAVRTISLTNLPDGRAIVEVGDSRIDLCEQEFSVLMRLLAPKTARTKVGE